MKKSNDKIRIGVLGAANIALRSVIPELKSLNHIYDFIGVASRTPEKVVRQEIPGIDFWEGYESILDKDIIDAVYIPLPNSYHYKWVKESLNKGLHVLVEKSLACDYKEVVELNKIAKKNDLALLENFQFRFHSQLEYILNTLKKGTLGEIRIIRSSFCFPPFSNRNNIRYNPELGGGALLDAGAYPVKLSQILMGDEIQVSSAVINKQSGFDVDIWGGALLEQKNGNLFSQIAFGFDNYYQCNLEILGSKGKLSTNRIFTAGETIKPKILLETNSGGLKEVELQPDTHFKNMLIYFHELVTGVKDKNNEYFDNVNQSRLLNELKLKIKIE